MIKISGNPFDFAMLADTYANNSVEWQVLTAMSQSQEVYAYDTRELLEFELSLRREIINAAMALDRSRLSFATFHDARCNPTYWTRTDNGGFRLREDAKPSGAIEDIYKNSGQYATECATAMVIIFYKALLAVYGETVFNALFSRIYLMNWYIDEPLLQEVGIPKEVADVLLGDRGYFANPDVDPQTPHWQGENVIVLPNGLYYGHGIGIGTADQIIGALNNNRKPDATKPAHFMDAVSRPNFQRLFAAYQQAKPPAETLVWAPFPPPLAVRSRA